jgi:hypothetical protein
MYFEFNGQVSSKSTIRFVVTRSVKHFSILLSLTAQPAPSLAAFRRQTQPSGQQHSKRLHSPVTSIAYKDVIPLLFTTCNLPILSRVTLVITSMYFGNSLKGDDHTHLNDNVSSRPVEAKPARNTTIKMPSNGSYAPQAGFLPSSSEYDAPPPGPPTSYHDWQTAVPDTSLLPPPPSLGNRESRTNNATRRQAEQGESWCRANPLIRPVSLPHEALLALENGEMGVVKPRGYRGELKHSRPGVWAGETKLGSPDTCITSSIPLYSALAHSPMLTGQTKTIYYEVRIAKRNRREVSLALGFAAPPYPTFRLPGWHRGCLAVHGDDGSRYVNDIAGGKDFTDPFKAGETLGIGMVFKKREFDVPPAYGEGPTRTEATTPIDAEIFFTRDGRKSGRWNLHEEVDADDDLPVTGLEGMHDLVAAVGTFENVEFDIVFNQGEWMYRL